MGVITLRTLAKALFYCSADLQGGRSMESLLRCLGVDPKDKGKAEQARDEIRLLDPNLENHLHGEAKAGAVLSLPRNKNPYQAGTVKWHLWESMKGGDWREGSFIYACVQPCLAAEGSRALAVFNRDFEVFTNPWHPENGGRSFLRQTRNEKGARLYRLEFTVPKFVIEICRQAWGAIPAPPKDVPHTSPDNVTQDIRQRDKKQSLH